MRIVYTPVEIWRLNEETFTKVFVMKKPVVRIILDPFRETADIDVSNNYWPAQVVPDRFELFKSSNTPRGASRGENPMRRATQQD